MRTAAPARESVQEIVFLAQRSPRLFLIVVFLFAFALRLSVMFATSSYHIVEDDTDHFGFGWEMGRVARSLVEGAGFSSPLPMPTGPTAIVGPVYPLLLALIFKVFGVYSTASAVAVRVLQSVFASLTCLFVYLCGRDTAGESTGKLAALAWAVFPLNIFFTVTKVWETSLTALLAAALFWYMLPLRYSLSLSRWSATGALLGIAALLNTSLVMLVVPFGLLALWKNRASAILPATVGALTCFALLSPWLVRNHTEFGKFILRSNFPLEFRVGNNEWSHGQKIEDLHPSNTPALNQHWKDVGEARFMAEDRDANSRFLAAHPGRFAFATLSRIVNYWTGAWIMPTADSPNQWPVIVGISIVSLLGLLGILRMFYSGNSAAFMYASCLLIYPLVYYVTTSQPRFYHAITPLLIVPGAFWVLNFRRTAVATSGFRGEPASTGLPA
jgi:4-amino-4-deoxy-L-arabinose transferase-like glycosyltransferase